MSRKRCRRRIWAAIPPRELLPKLPADQVRELSLVHSSNLDLLATGQASEQVMWDLVSGVLLWSKAAEQLKAGVDEMLEQVQLATAIVQRYGRTGRVGLSGAEYQLAKRGVEVMDQLAELVDKPTAIACAEWGLLKMREMAAAAAAEVRRAA
jgi:hypothetical protein